MDWILHPLVSYGLAGAGLMLCAYLFLATKREARRATLHWQERHDSLEQEVIALDKALADAQGELSEIRDRSATLVEPPPAASGLNLNKRTQVLRMSRRGESTESIAAALAMPLREVELLLKVEQMSTEKSPPELANG